MEFADIAEAFDQIRAAVGRNQVIQLLSHLYRDNPADADVLTYLLQGRLGPAYATPDLGLDEKRIAEAVGIAAGIPTSVVVERFRKVGDLGIVASDIVQHVGGDVSSRAVYDELRSIASLSGAGSYRARVERFARILEKVGKGSAAALIRVATGTVRLGIGDVTIIDALSIACRGDLKLRPSLKHAYSRCSDLGLVATTLLRQGVAGLDDIQPTPGRPVLPALAERLPSSEEIVRRLGNAYAEPKYDGVRIQAQRSDEHVWLFTRRLEDVSKAFPDIARGVREQVRARGVILDGEVVGYDPKTGRFLPLQETVRRRRTHGVDQAVASIPVFYYVFDVLNLDGQDLTGLPYRERIARLSDVVEERRSGPIRLAPRTPIHDPAALDRFVEEMLADGLEGAVVKRPESAYEAGARTYNWVKVKREYSPAVADTFDVVVIGYFLGKGRRASLGIGALLGAAYDPETDRFRTVCRIGSGLSDTQWVDLRTKLDADRSPSPPIRVDSRIVPDVWVEPRYVVEVLAAGITRSPLHTSGQIDNQPGYALRFPRILRIRDDRRPEDATTQSEIVDMYRLEHHRA